MLCNSTVFCHALTPCHCVKGLEIHCSATDCPFSFTDTLDFDAVFRDEVDQSTFSLYVGCGGCVATADPIVIPPFPLTGYEPAVIEPFTQVCV